MMQNLVPADVIAYWKSIQTDIIKTEVVACIADYFNTYHYNVEYQKLVGILCGVLQIKEAAGYLPPKIREYMLQIIDQLLYTIEIYEGENVRFQIYDVLKR